MISVVIPSYKNKTLLLNNLSLNLRFLKNCEIIVVNDYPVESIKPTLAKFKNIKVIENKTNLGFGGAVNVGVHASQSSYVMILNSDVILHDESFMDALSYFKGDPALFAVSFAQKEHDGSIVGKNKILWRRGMFQHSKAGNLKSGINGWAEGGSMMVDKSKFLTLGGFDEIYKPFYWEDIDLSYRAWRAGMKILFDHEILVKHHHESTIGKYFKKKEVDQIAFRNQLIFIWKNVTDKRLLLSHLWFLPKYVIYPSFWDALILLPNALRIRKKQKKLFIISDDEILKKFID